MKRIFDYLIFDADDTLWINEPFFRETEQKLCGLLQQYADADEILRILYRKEMQNLEIYGYGIKGFILSMLETGLEISDKQLSAECVDQIISLGKQQLTHPVELVDGVKETLRALFPRYKLVMATKGDLLDQERKLKLSGLKDFFCHVEIMSDKTEDAYQKLLTDLDAVPENIMMIGNSMKSDILPVLKLGGYAGYVPFYTTWIHEVVSDEVDHPKLTILESIKELKNLLL